MNIGMLWFDNDPKAEFGLKIKRAVSYYQEKYGQAPNLCFVHPSMIISKEPQNEDAALKLGSVEVRPSKAVLPNHFWIGINSHPEALAV